MSYPAKQTGKIVGDLPWRTNGVNKFKRFHVGLQECRFLSMLCFDIVKRLQRMVNRNFGWVNFPTLTSS